MSKKTLWNGPVLFTNQGYLVCDEFGIRLYREEMFKGKTTYSKANKIDESIICRTISQRINYFPQIDKKHRVIPFEIFPFILSLMQSIHTSRNSPD